MRVHMIGNAHIDPVWLWPWQAGADEALATLVSAADRCDEYPEFVFTRGEAWVYQQAERLRPDLFARIRRLVERGQWHITGGQFIQPDLNLPTAAGLHRQIVHGQRYFRERFGVTPTIGYNVDSFGHTASLPDILAAHSYTAYVFRRPEQHQVALPANTFVWQGINGAEVVAFRINPGYVANFADLTGQVKIAVPALGHTMCFYGVGNHGGGPSKAMIEWIIANRSFDGHELVFSTPQAFMEAIADRRELLPRVTVELQRTFPGCYSVMHDVKQAQRYGEQLLVQAEAAARALASAAAERDDSLARLDRAWDDLLFTEFHDILTGTSIPAAWDSVRAMQGGARIAGEEVLFDTTRRWSYRTLPRVDEHQIVVVNTDARPRRDFVEAEPYLDFDDWGGRWISALLSLGGIGQHLRKDTTDTWTFHTDRWEEPVEATLVGAAWQVEEAGPLRVRARLDGRLRNSRIRLTVSVGRGEPAVHVDLEVNFAERYTLLQMPVELAAPPSGWTDGIADGHVGRAPSPAEWPFVGWSRLRVGDVDVGLVISDFYSHSVNGAVWQPTLLRSPRMAWGGGDPHTYSGHDHHTDQGFHRFAFDLHFGERLSEADLAAALRHVAQPLIVFDRYEGMDRPAWGPVPPRGLWGPAMLRNVAEGRAVDPGLGDPGGLFKRPGHDDYAG